MQVIHDDRHEPVQPVQPPVHVVHVVQAVLQFGFDTTGLGVGSCFIELKSTVLPFLSIYLYLSFTFTTDKNFFGIIIWLLITFISSNALPPRLNEYRFTNTSNP